MCSYFYRFSRSSGNPEECRIVGEQLRLVHISATNCEYITLHLLGFFFLATGVFLFTGTGSLAHSVLSMSLCTELMCCRIRDVVDKGRPHSTPHIVHLQHEIHLNSTNLFFCTSLYYNPQYLVLHDSIVNTRVNNM